MGLTAAIRGIVTVRDGGRCIICGNPTTQVHHRRPKGMGGTRLDWVNLPANLLLLCGSGTQGCHGWVEHYRRRALEGGWLISRYGQERACQVPVRYDRDREWRLLDDQGGYVTVNPTV